MSDLGNTGNVGSTGQTYLEQASGWFGVSGNGMPFALTGEALLVYCQTQLNGIDQDVKTFMDQQKLNIAKKKILGDLASTMEQYSPPADKTQFKAIGDAVDKAMQDLKALGLPANDASVAGVFNLGCQLYDHYAKYGGLAGGLGYESWKKNFNENWASDGWSPSKGSLGFAMGNINYTGAELVPYQGLVSKAKDLVSDVSGNAELNMIQLQALMSKRQTAVQLTTNMMAKLDQGIASIAGTMT